MCSHPALCVYCMIRSKQVVSHGSCSKWTDQIYEYMYERVRTSETMYSGVMNVTVLLLFIVKTECFVRLVIYLMPKLGLLTIFILFFEDSARALFDTVIKL